MGRKLIAFARVVSALAFDVFIVMIPAAVILFVIASVACGGLYSFEQVCTTGQCKLTAGPASCVAIGHTQNGGTAILTAKHCVEERQNTFYIVGEDDAGTVHKSQATVVAVSRDADVAILYTGVKQGISPFTHIVPAGGYVRSKGLLSRRYNESEGTVEKLDQNRSRFWMRGVYSHAGMSGGPLLNVRGEVFGVMSSKVDGEGGETIGAGGDSIRRLVIAFEAKYGPLLRAGAKRVERQQMPRYERRQQAPAYGPATSPRSESTYSQSSQGTQGKVCPKCGKVHDYDCYVLKIPRGKQGPKGDSVDVEALTRAVLSRIRQPSDGRTGATGPTGPQGDPGSVDYDYFAELFFERYGPQLRGQAGADGATGGRGLVGVPSEADIQNWLIGASSNPATKKMLATVLADIVKADPRVDDLIQRLVAVENAPTGGGAELVAVAGRVEAIEAALNKIQPVQVLNPGGDVYSEDIDRRLIDPIVIQLDKPKE